MEQEKKKDQLEDYFVEKIQRSGYPLEIEASSMLDRDYYVSNTHYYFDEEEGKGRDIDIYAVPISSLLLDLDERLAPLRLRTELVIECKRSETHSWFFYPRPRIPMKQVYMDGQLRTSVPRPMMFSVDSFQWFLEDKCLPLHYDEFDRSAVAYEEIKKKKTASSDGSGRREIFEAKNQLVKFVCYETHEAFKRLSRIPGDSPERELIIVLFPIIVFDGDLFEVTFDSGKPKLERKDHLLLSTDYRCPYCLEVESYTIDVVHRLYFRKFLETIGGYLQTMRKRMLENKEELLKRAKETRMKSETEKAAPRFA